VRLTDEHRRQTEARIRAAMDRLLRAELPPGGNCDIKTLAAEAGVTRTGFYPKGDRPGPYQHLAEEFERRQTALQEAGQIPDPKDGQISRLKAANTALRRRIAERDTAVAELTAFKTLAISRLAAQHQEIERLRTAGITGPDNVREMPTRRQHT
jgi:hypothetical protein